MSATKHTGAVLPDVQIADYYADETIRITNHYIRINAKLYSAYHITSLNMKKVAPDRVIPALVGFVCGFVVGALIGVLVDNRGALGIVMGLAAGLALAVVLARMPKDSYQIEYNLSSGEVASLESRSEDYIKQLYKLSTQVMIQSHA